MAKVKGVDHQIRPADTFRYLLELWDDLMFLAEMMLSDSTASAAPSSTSALFLMRPDRTRNIVVMTKHLTRQERAS